MWLNYVKQKEERKGLENFQVRRGCGGWVGGGGGGGVGGSWVYEAGKTEDDPNEKGWHL